MVVHEERELQVRHVDVLGAGSMWEIVAWRYAYPYLIIHCLLIGPFCLCAFKGREKVSLCPRALHRPIFSIGCFDQLADLQSTSCYHEKSETPTII